jgi:polyhydroxybutyrate depolymerase
MSKYLQTAVGLFLSALLVACGGGGRGGSVPDSNPEPVNPEPVNPAGPTVANPSTGCSAASGILTDSGTYTMSFNGIERTFRLHVPQGYNTTSASPMALVFHGWGGNEDEFLGDTTVTGEADQRGYILVAPRGIGSGSPDNSYNSWSFSGSTTGLDGDGGSGVESAICDYEKTDDYNYPSCAGIAENSCAWTQCQQDDVAFTVELIDHINSRMCVDTDNIYASGGSNGGMFTWELGQNPVTAPLLRAIAPIIGLPHRGYLAPKGKNEDMPALLITGINDATVPPGEWEDESFTTTSDGDFFFYSGANAIMKSWAQAHSCDVLNPARVFATGYAETDCRTYCSADPGWPRVLDCRSDMGHTYDFGWTWPLVMDFFDQHAM